MNTMNQMNGVPPGSMGGAENMMMNMFAQFIQQQGQQIGSSQSDDCFGCGNGGIPARDTLDEMQSRFVPLTNDISIKMKLLSGQVGRLYGPVTQRAYDIKKDGYVVVDTLDAQRYLSQRMQNGALMFEEVHDEQNI